MSSFNRKHFAFDDFTSTSISPCFQLGMETIRSILIKCRGIISTVAEVKTNKTRCREVADNVKTLQVLVESISRRGNNQISSNMSRTLCNLLETLTIAHELVKKFTKTFVSKSKYNSDFKDVNKSLNDSYNILSGAQQVTQGNSMLGMYQDFGLDYSDGVGLSGAVSPYYSAAAASPSFSPVTFRPQPITAVYAAAVEVGDNSLYYSEAFYISQ